MRFALIVLTTVSCNLIGSGAFAEEPVQSQTIDNIFSEGQAEPDALPASTLAKEITNSTIPTDADQQLISAPVTQLSSFETGAACNSAAGCNCQSCTCNACTLCDRIPLLRKFPSDRCFDDFVMPVSNPVWSIDPRSLTYVRGVFVNQMIDSQTPVLGAGDLQIYALQLGIALNERLSFIAIHDGYNTLQTRGVGNSAGWADIGLGFKYVLIRDVENQFLLSGGLVYEATNGSTRVFQGNGDGVWSPYLSVGKQIGCGHVIASSGFHFPGNTAEESTSFYYAIHYDRPVTDKLSAIVELNGIVYTKSGQALPLSIEGGDWINLGSSNVAGNNVVTTAFGANYRLNQCLSVAGAWEFPISNRKDLLDSRTTVTLTLQF